jgi:hypothetical protein
LALDWNRYKSNYMKFDSVGDSIEGTILALSEGEDFNGHPCPQLTIDTDSGPRKVTCGQVMLQAALAEKEPLEGDFVRITYSGAGEIRPGRTPAKLFSVTVTRKGAEEAVAAADLA